MSDNAYINKEVPHSVYSSVEEGTMIADKDRTFFVRGKMNVRSIETDRKVHHILVLEPISVAEQVKREEELSKPRLWA